MADRKVSVVLQAIDKITGPLRGLRANVKTWAEDVTKIAAGVGLADGLKEVGRVIRDGIQQAAEAYPVLGASLKRVTDQWTEFKVQAGAAFLQVLQPALPLLESLLGFATRLATQLPDAFDGARIVMARVIGAFREFPGAAQQAFGGAARAAAEFIDKAGFVLALFGTDAGLNAADRLNAFGNAQIQAGERSRRAARAGTDATVAGIAGTVRTPGPRAESPEAKKAREDAAEAVRREFLARGLNSAESGLRADGGPNVVGGRELQLRLGSDFEAIIPQVEAAGAAFTDFVTTLEKVEHQMGFISDATVALSERFAGIGDVVGGKVGDAAKKILGPIMKIEGSYYLVKGLAKIADSLFPPNPAGLASGSGMVARGRQLLALAGAGGGAAGSAGGGGGGGLSSDGFTRNRAEQAAARNAPASVTLKRGYVRTDDPDFQDFLVQTFRLAGGRDVVVSYE